ncbi:MAG: hypothetical protein FWC20_03780 [Oscillospiraceae bacterium]|nr:hypothetical protein [Oscillospiraceae bacterium]MCL2278512.1 hypothetical protein [Oscillospiraceae bacterium]
MTKLKAEAIELIQDIPDDKVAVAIEFLKELQVLYEKKENPVTQNEKTVGAMGIFAKYANSDLVPLEKEAWGEALREKHANY